MDAMQSNRVRLPVRIAAAAITAFFCVGGLLGALVLGMGLWSTVRTGHMPAKQVLAGSVLLLGAYTSGSIFFVVAQSGEHPRWDDDDEPEDVPRAV
jgi:hypothetical protein